MIIFHLKRDTKYKLIELTIYMMFQELLEEHNIPFVGTGSSECQQAFDKVRET